MKGSLKFSVLNRIRSVKCAGHGITTMMKYEHNAWVHALATFIACGAGFYFGFTKSEWCLIVLAIIAVWTAEALNTALELLADVASPGFHPEVKKAKDVAAGAVLITCIGSVIIGALILCPYLF